MIYAEIKFWTDSVNPIQFKIPSPPNIGDSITIPAGVIKDVNGNEVIENRFRVLRVNWFFVRGSTNIDPPVRFYKLIIHVEKI
jgi:hypothetical protein